MPITRTPMIDDDGSGTTGTILNNAWKQELYNQIDAFVGAWSDIPFDPAKFHGSGGLVWTVSAAPAYLAYAVTGKSALVSWDITGTTTGAVGGTELSFDLPTGLNARGSDVALCRILLLGAWETGLVYVQPGQSKVKFARMDLTPFPLGALAVQGQVFFGVL